MLRLYRFALLSMRKKTFFLEKCVMILLWHAKPALNYIGQLKPMQHSYVMYNLKETLQ